MGHVSINRRIPNAAIERLNRVRDDLPPGTLLIIFPEGTRKNHDGLGRFKRVAFIMAKNLNMPILPITLIGTDEIVPAVGIDLFPGKAVIHIHPPMKWVMPASKNLKRKRTALLKACSCEQNNQ